jgi:hypothetical protein
MTAKEIASARRYTELIKTSFEGVEDPRVQGRVTHPLLNVLTIVLLAVLSGGAGLGRFRGVRRNARRIVKAGEKSPEIAGMKSPYFAARKVRFWAVWIKAWQPPCQGSQFGVERVQVARRGASL